MFEVVKSFIIFILCPIQDSCSTRMTLSTLKDFGYQFHDQKLRKLDEKGDVTEEGFQFVGSSVGIQENLRPLFFIKKDMQVW